LGFPLFELLVTPLVALGRWYLSNAVAVLSGLVVIAAILHLARGGRLRHPAPTVVCAAFLPIVLTSASSTMDYLPALALLVWSYIAAIDRRWTLAAVLIGVACGFRPTSVLFVVPVATYAYLDARRPTVALRVILIALACAALAYSPVLLEYGVRTARTAIALDPSTRALITGYNGLKVFGIVQTLALCAALVPAIREQLRRGTGRSFLVFHLLNIAAWALLFALRGDEPEYLMPAVPSIILLLDGGLSARAFWVVVAVLLSYSVIQFDVLGGESGARTIEPSVRPGLLIQDAQDRIFKLSTREAADAYAPTQRTVLMLGSTWIPTTNEAWVFDAEFGMDRQRDGMLYVSPRITDEARLRELRTAGFRLVVWRGSKWEYLRAGMPSWQDHVEVVDDLAGFFGAPVRGRAMNDW
jgi:hypothetical protein